MFLGPATTQAIFQFSVVAILVSGEDCILDAILDATFSTPAARCYSAAAALNDIVTLTSQQSPIRPAAPKCRIAPLRASIQLVCVRFSSIPMRPCLVGTALLAAGGSYFSSSSSAVNSAAIAAAATSTAA
jgi:hypothetical protein